MDFFSCRNISKSYNHEVVLQNVNIAFPSTGIVSLIGPSGCGKSTLFNCLLGIEECEGKVIFNNKEIEDFSSFRNRYTGVIFQNFHLFEYLNVEENIKLFNCKNKDYDKVVKMLGLETKLKTKVSLLSGGEKQRVAIARTLLKKPKIIFCDEITGSLDEENQEVIMKYLKEISKEILVVNISHNETLVNRYSDEIITYHNHSFYLNSLSKKDVPSVNGKIKLSSYKLFNHSVNLMRKSNFKIILSIMSLVISFLLSGMIVSINRSLKEYFNEYKTSCLDYNFIELSESKTIKIPNTSFSLVKQNRPKDFEKIEQKIPNCSALTNYSNLINSYTYLQNNNEDIKANFYPTENNKLTSYRKIIINESMKKLLKSDYIHYQNKRSIDYLTSTNQIIRDEINIDIVFEVVSINKEMDIFQEPTIYYSYFLLEKYFDSIKLPNFSKHMKSRVTLQERIANYSYEGDFFDTGSIYLRSHQKQEVENIIKIGEKIKNDELSYHLESRSLSSFKAYNTLLDSITHMIEIFLLLSLLTSFALLVLCINALILDEQKEIGVFKGLGLLDEQIFKIIVNQVMLIIVSSYIFSLFLKFIIYTYFQIKVPFLNILGAKNLLFENLVIIIFTFIVSLILIFISRLKVERIDIAKVLRED